MQRLFLYMVTLTAAVFINISSAHAVPVTTTNPNTWTQAVQRDGSLDISRVDFGSLQFSSGSNFVLLNTDHTWHPVGGVWLPRPQWPVFLASEPTTVVNHTEVNGLDVICVQDMTGSAGATLYLPEGTAATWIVAATSWPGSGFVYVLADSMGSAPVAQFWPGTVGVGAGNQWGVYDSQLLAGGDYYDALAVGTSQAGVATCIGMIEIAGGPRGAVPIWP